MDPLTHIAVSFAASRAGINRTTRLATPMLVVSGLAADLDWLGALFGPRSFLIGHRTVTHSLVGTAAIAIITAICFTLAARKHPKSPIQFSNALIICAVGAVLHLALDICNSYGVKLLWPLSDRWFALDILPKFDLWILMFLLAGILLPMLFRMVTEEIGAKQKSKSGTSGAILAFALLLLYTGGRYVLHTRAIDLLASRLYQGGAPLVVGAFPDSPSPFHWSGAIITDAALFRVEVPVVFGNFDPFSAKLFYKPEPSPALDAARATQTALLFLNFARIPRARIEKNEHGFQVEITDMRFEIGSPPGRSMAAIIDLDSQARVVHEELRFGDLFER
jgi:inner membrane protein